MYFWSGPVASDILEEGKVRLAQTLRLHHPKMEEQPGGGSIHQF